MGQLNKKKRKIFVTQRSFSLSLTVVNPQYKKDNGKVRVREKELEVVEVNKTPATTTSTQEDEKREKKWKKVDRKKKNS